MLLIFAGNKCIMVRAYYSTPGSSDILCGNHHPRKNRYCGARSYGRYLSPLPPAWPPDSIELMQESVAAGQLASLRPGKGTLSHSSFHDRDANHQLNSMLRLDWMAGEWGRLLRNLLHDRNMGTRQRFGGPRARLTLRDGRQSAAGGPPEAAPLVRAGPS